MKTLKKSSGRKSSPQDNSGFSRTELAVVAVMLLFLALLVLPAIAGSRPNNSAFQCLNNLRQLQRAWSMYAYDNDGHIVRSGGPAYGVTYLPNPWATPGDPRNQWVYGDITVPISAANSNLIKAGLLYPYLNSIEVYKCPADKRSARGPQSAEPPPSVRSYSLNCWMNPIQSWNNTTTHVTRGRDFRKLSDLENPGPAKTFTFIDENPWSIDDGWFVCDPTMATWVSIPATRHDGCGGIAFADGHSEMRKWSDPGVLTYTSNTPNSSRLPPSPPLPGGDLGWLQDRSTIIVQ